MDKYIIDAVQVYLSIFYFLILLSYNPKLNPAKRNVMQL